MKSVFMQLVTAFQGVLPRWFLRQVYQYYFDDEVMIETSDNAEEVWDFDDQEICYLPYDEWQLHSAVAVRHLLEDYKRGYRDFSRIVLIGADLRGADLRRMDFSNSQFWRANLQGADLRGANLCFARMQDANLRDANLSNADLTCASLVDADLTDANLEGAILHKAFMPDGNGGVIF